MAPCVRSEVMTKPILKADLPNPSVCELDENDEVFCYRLFKQVSNANPSAVSFRLEFEATSMAYLVCILKYGPGIRRDSVHSTEQKQKVVKHSISLKRVSMAMVQTAYFPV